MWERLVFCLKRYTRMFSTSKQFLGEILNWLCRCVQKKLQSILSAELQHQNSECYISCPSAQKKKKKQRGFPRRIKSAERDGVIAFTPEPLSELKARETPLLHTSLKHVDGIRGSRVIKPFRTIAIFGRRQLSWSLRPREQSAEYETYLSQHLETVSSVLGEQAELQDTQTTVIN